MNLKTKIYASILKYYTKQYYNNIHNKHLCSARTTVWHTTFFRTIILPQNVEACQFFREIFQSSAKVWYKTTQHINILTPLMPCFNTITGGALSRCDLICKECLLVILKKFIAPRCRGSLGLVDRGRGWGEGSPIREAVFKRTH